MNGIVIARDGEAWPLTLSDRLRPPGIGFGVGWIHVYPATVYGDQLEESERVAARTARALGLRDRDRVPAADRRRRTAGSPSSSARRGSPAARWPTSSGTRSASTSSRCSSGWRSARSFPTSSCRRSSASRSRSASSPPHPGPLHAGPGRSRRLAREGACVSGRRAGRDVSRRGRGDPAGAARRRPPRLRHRDRRHEPRGARPRRGGGAARRRRGRAGMSCDFSLGHYRELLEAAKAGGYRFAGFDRRAGAGRPDPAPRRRPLARGRGRDGRGRGRGGRLVDVVPDDALGLLQPRLGRGRAARSRGCASSAGASPTTRSGRTSTSTSASSRSSPGTTPTRST